MTSPLEIIMDKTKRFYVQHINSIPCHNINIDKFIGFQLVRTALGSTGDVLKLESFCLEKCEAAITLFYMCYNITMQI